MKVSTHNFGMNPRSDIPRASFSMPFNHKTTFNASDLIPIYVQEILPGDTFHTKMTGFARMTTPIFPIMDNLHMETFFFFVPNRLVWDNWVKFMGEQRNPGDTTDYEVPTLAVSATGFAPLSIYTYMGLPQQAQMTTAGNITKINALPFRAYNLILNEWFRPQDLAPSYPTPTDDGPDPLTNYAIRRRSKRYDYFTQALPWAQKDSSVPLPLAEGMNVKRTLNAPAWTAFEAGLQVAAGPQSPLSTDAVSTLRGPGASLSLDPMGGLYVDLTGAGTINQLRQAVQIQKLLEHNARGGTRYIEIIREHFNVVSPNASLQRPEYLGGGYSPINISPIAQTSATGTYADTPLGNLAAIGTATPVNHGFHQSFTEHGFVIGLVNVRADITYQQGVARFWRRKTKWDYYWPVFQMLGEQAILNSEIYATDTAADNDAFGYVPRWDEYRYNPSIITGLFNSSNTTPLDAWHLAQHFATAPTLNTQFITDDTKAVVERASAIAISSDNQQFLFDSEFRVRATRAVPVFSPPGMMDHF